MAEGHEIRILLIPLFGEELVVSFAIGSLSVLLLVDCVEMQVCIGIAVLDHVLLRLEVKFVYVA